MKKYLLTLLLLPVAASAQTPADCAKSTEACSSKTKQFSPFFMASTLSEAKAPPPAPAPAKKPAVVPAAQASFAVSSAPAAAAVQQPAETPGKTGLSSPLWLVFVGGILAGLYFYLREGRRRARRK